MEKFLRKGQQLIQRWVVKVHVLILLLFSFFPIRLPGHYLLHPLPLFFFSSLPHPPPPPPFTFFLLRSSFFFFEHSKFRSRNRKKLNEFCTTLCYVNSRNGSTIFRSEKSEKKPGCCTLCKTASQKCSGYEYMYDVGEDMV